MNNEIGKRIAKLINTLEIKKVRFAERLKLDQSYVTQLTNGKRNPSDRTISDICREFNVREEWLRNGSGEMFLDFTENEFSKAASALSNDTFIKSLIIEYCKLDENSKKLFKDFIHKLSNNMQDLENTENTSTPSPSTLSVEEAEAEYIKSLSNSANKKDLSVSNITAGIDRASNQ